MSDTEWRIDEATRRRNQGGAAASWARVPGSNATTEDGIDRVNILGVRVGATNLAAAVEHVAGLIRNDRRSYLCVADAHVIVESRRDPAFRALLNEAALVTADGMPLVWLARANGYRSAGRVYGPDLMLAVIERMLPLEAIHFFYGASETTLGGLQEKLRQRFPGIRVGGAISPPFRALSAAEERDTIDAINRARPHIVWVGLGAPKQEMWMARNRPRLDANVLIGVGAAFDFHAGLVRQAPLWLQRSGFEWLFRIVQEPRRLWRRYLLTIPRFIVEVAAQHCGAKRYAIAADDPHHRISQEAT
jgi:N-acetylglucosaminyldiphosphoundecaprenol N-acetyl-beta-D-mannosaminyltransferase